VAKLSYNLDDIPDVPDIPKGRYKARLLSCTKKKSRADKPMLEWKWKLLTGKVKGSTIRSFTSLQENALSSLKQHLIALGKKGKVQGSTDELVGKVVVLVVGKHPYKNDMGQKVMSSYVVGLLPKDSPLEEEKHKAHAKDEDDESEDDEEEAEEEEEEEEEDGDEEDEEEEEEDEDDKTKMMRRTKKRKRKMRSLSLRLRRRSQPRRRRRLRARSGRARTTSLCSL
jgi:Mg-chelatase subunit ChlI